MPIRPFLHDEQFDQETIRILGVAFAQVCIALRIGECDDDDIKQAIANKIIALAKTGERNPDLLCERALEDIRQTASVGGWAADGAGAEGAPGLPDGRGKGSIGCRCLSWLSLSPASQHICFRTRNSVYQEKTASGRSLSPADTVITLD